MVISSELASPDEWERGGIKKTPLEVSFAVFNEKTQKWETPLLKPGEKTQILNALDVIHESGRIHKALEREGAILELTGNKIYLKEEGGKVQDLTSDLGWFNPTRGKIKKTLSSVKGIVKELSEGRQGAEVTPNLDNKIAKKEGGVVIELRVTPKMAERVQKEERFYQTLQADQEYLVSEAMANYLEACGLTREQINIMQEKHSNLVDAQGEIVTIMQEVSRLKNAGKIKEALEHYTTIYEAFEKYTKAVRGWEREQTLLKLYLGSEASANPFQRDFSRHASIQVGTVEALATYADEVLPGENTLGTTPEFLRWVSTNYLDNRTFYQFEAAEHAEQARIERMLTGWEEWAIYLEERGFSQEDIENAHSKLRAVLEAQTAVAAIMNQVTNKLEEGSFDEAYEHYKANIALAHGRYCDALREWHPQQKLLQDYLGTDPQKNPFQFDPKHVSFQLKVAKALAKRLSGQEFATVIQDIQSNVTNFTQTDSFIAFSKGEWEKLYQQEGEFQFTVAEALAAFEDRIFTDSLQQEGFTVEEIEDHREKLRELKAASTETLQMLSAVERFFQINDIVGGLNYYRESGAAILPRYQEALRQLVIPQRVAENRLHDLAPFSLDLHRLEKHEEMLFALSQKQSELNLTKGQEPFAPIEQPLTTVTALKEAYTSDFEFKRLSTVFNAMRTGLDNVLHPIGSFVEHFTQRRDEFERLMRKEGYSDLETAALFNHFIDIYKDFKGWEQGLKEATDLANRKQYSEALDRFSQMVKDNYSMLNIHLLRFLPFNTRFGDPRLANVLRKFSPGLTPTELNLFRYTTSFKLQIDELQQALEASGVEVSEAFQEARQQITEQTEKNDATVGEQTRLFKQDLRFMKFFNLFNLRQHPTLGPIWRGILSREKWTTTEAKAFTHIFNDYAALIQQLQEGERAVESEQNPVKKRALRAQVMQLAVRLRPQLRRLDGEFKKLGGHRRVASLLRAVDRFASSARQDLERDYAANQRAYEALGLNSVEEVVAHLEEKLQGIPETLMQQYKEPLAWVNKIKMSEKLRGEAESLQELIIQRREFVRDFYIRHHFFVPWENNTLARITLSGPHAKDPVYQELLETHGWDPKEIEALSKWYDRYHHAMDPVALARARLAEDPESVLLQREFQETYDKQIGKINALAAEFRKRFKSLDNVKNLEWACALYANQAEKEVARIEQILKKSSESMQPNELKDYVTKLENYEIALKTLQEASFADEIAMMDEWMVGAGRLATQKLSWERGYLGALTAKGSPLLDDLPKELTIKDLKAIQSLFKRYQDQLRTINELERKLEAVPGNSRLRSQLRKELQAHFLKRKALNEDREKYSEKIVLLQAAINEKEMGIDVLGAFAEKIDFMNDVDRRHGL